MKKNINLNEYNLPISIEKEKLGGFVARCSLWSDCYAQGDTIEEVMLEISAVATSLIELYTEENMVIPLNLKKKFSKSADKFNLDYSLIVSV